MVADGRALSATGAGPFRWRFTSAPAWCLHSSQSALNAAFKLAVLTWQARRCCSAGRWRFGPLLTWALLYTFEWQFLLVYWGIVAAHHALRASRELRRREVSEARLEARLVESQLEFTPTPAQPAFLLQRAESAHGARAPRSARGRVDARAIGNDVAGLEPAAAGGAAGSDGRHAQARTIAETRRRTMMPRRRGGPPPGGEPGSDSPAPPRPIRSKPTG